MAKNKQIMLTHGEIGYLLDLALSNKERGGYRGKRDQFEARQDRVIGKLETAANTKLGN